MWKAFLSKSHLFALFLLVGCAASRSLTPATQPTSPNWEKEIAAFEAADKTNPPPPNAILFIGSSSIRLWDSVAADFPDHKVINRGFGGSQIIDSAHYAARIVMPYRPRMIVFYAGGNDINAGKPPEEVFADYKLFVSLVHRDLPRTRIAYISSAPNPLRWEQVEKVKRLNSMIKDFGARDKRLVYIDVFPHMLGPDGKPKPDIFRPDRLHMNAKGYAIWKLIVAPYLNF